jgi:uncharacterized membrane protein YkvA (DUF1232 family)
MNQFVSHPAPYFLLTVSPLTLDSYPHPTRLVQSDMIRSVGKETTMKFYDWYRNLIRNSKYRWLIIAGTLLYLFSPIDILPDVIPLLGQIDDTVVLGLLVAEISSLLMDRLKAQKNDPNEVVQATPSSDAVDVEATTVK